MQHDEGTETGLGSKGRDPYHWLPVEPGYRVPPPFDAAIAPGHEQNGTRALIRYLGEDFGKLMSYVGPVLTDPDHGPLTGVEREMIATVVSAINGCISCQLRHTRQLGEGIGDAQRARRVAINYRAVRLSPRERAICDYAVKLTETPGRIAPEDSDPLRSAVLSNDEIFSVVQIVAIDNFTNRLTSRLGLRPDDEVQDGDSA